MPDEPPVPEPAPEKPIGAETPSDDASGKVSAPQNSTGVESPAGVPAVEAGAGAGGGGGPPEKPFVVDLSQVPTVSPPLAPVERMDPRSRAGVTLSKWLLVMISIFVLLCVIWIWSSECVSNQRVWELAKPVAAGDLEATNQLTAFYKNVTDFREFWLKMFQMVLLNVLLPVLTALLGYVFGSAQREPPRNP